MGYLYDIGLIKPYTDQSIGDYNYRVYLDYHIEFIRGDYWFVSANGKIGMSVDGGNYVANTITFSDYEKIEFSYIFGNGNLIFATQNKVYKSTDKCKTITEMSVIDLDGEPYTPITDSTNYRNISCHEPVYINGKEVLMTGNYTNYGFDPTDVNIYYCTEDLTDFRVVYKFGNSSRYSDPNMGNSDNEIICRHVHAITWDAYTDKFWINTGDAVIDGKNENHWMTAEYINNNWVFTVIVSGSDTSHYKDGGLYFDEDNIYVSVDIDVEGGSVDNGVWKIARTSITSEESFIKMNTSIHPSLPGYQKGADIVYGTTFLNGIPNVLYISRDNGNTWEELTITDGLAVESTFLRPRIENNIIRIDAKSTSFRAGAFTYHVPTILFYLE